VELRVRRSVEAHTLDAVSVDNPLPVSIEGAPAPGHVYAAYEDITVSTSAVDLTAARWSGSRVALISVETAAVRFKFDINPTALLGHILEPGDWLELENEHEIANITFIRKDSVDAVLRVSYGK